MRSYNVYDDSRIKKVEDNPYKGSTAYYLFHKDNVYPYKVDRVHFKMKNGTHQMSMATSGDRRETHQLNLSLVPVTGTIIEMCDYYNDGATVGIDSGKIALRIYKRILDHLEAHLHAMQTDLYYIPPTDNTLKELSEFATAIRFKALEEDPFLDQPGREFEEVTTLRNTRSFIGIEKTTIDLSAKKAPVKSLDKMDAIERYLAMLGE